MKIICYIILKKKQFANSKSRFISELADFISVIRNERVHIFRDKYEKCWQINYEPKNNIITLRVILRNFKQKISSYKSKNFFWRI